ncbi:MAG TPA: CtpF protein [Aestuariivirgaceae bacterium]|nr:CtpF protein [Aestuariivirgaceae bacterium]
MTNLAVDTRDAPPAPVDADATPGQGSEEAVVRIPSVTIHAYCETPAMTGEIELATSHRRMSRATLTCRPGGIKAAIDQYREAATPNLIIIESSAAKDALVADLEALATVCDASTKVVVVGATNDIELYRELMRRGVSEYLPAPVDAAAVVSAVARVFTEPGAKKLGRVYAFVGAKGGTGSSMISHNVAWTLGRHSGAEVILADLDLPFGTASLDFNLEPASGIGDAVRDAARLDEQMLERLLTRCDEHLHLLAAPTSLDTPFDLDGEAFDAMLDLAQAHVSHVVLDIPHLWTAWARRMLLAADEVVLTAVPDLANLKHAKHLVDMLRQGRPDAPGPILVLNQVGMPKRPEIAVEEFADTIGLAPTIIVPFDAQTFGTAANSGRMIADVARRGPLPAAFRELAESLSGRAMTKRRGGLLGLGRLLSRKKPVARKA